MGNARGTVILIAVFVLLVATHVTSFVFLLRANDARSQAFEERHALSAGLYETSLATVALTRWMRFVAITGGEFQYNAYWEEIERDRLGQAFAIFAEWDAPQAEIEHLHQLQERRTAMQAIELAVLQLRSEGAVQEAIALAHGPELAALGIPFGGYVQELVTKVDARTQEMIDGALRRSDFFEAMLAASLLMLAAVGLLGLLKGSRIFLAVFVVLVGVNGFLTLSLVQMNHEKRDAYELQGTLVRTLYSLEVGTETLTRLSRMIAVTGGELQYQLYQEELAQDRFGQALDTFVHYRAPDSEINVLVDLIGRILGLRRIDAQVIQLSMAGYTQEAIALSFGPEFAALGIPTNAMNQSLREAVSVRIQAAVEAAQHRYHAFSTRLAINITLILLVGLAGIVWRLKHHDAQPKAASVLTRYLRRTTIATKMMASFGLVIAVFIMYVAIAYTFDAVIYDLNSHNAHYLMPRKNMVLTYHQEFTEMRRLISESFMNTEWLETANEGIWRSFEQRISASHARLASLVEAYTYSVRTDPVFPEMPDDSRIYIMTQIMSLVDMIYATYRANFFWSGDMNFDHSNVLNYSYAAETMLHLLRDIAETNQAVAATEIIQYRTMSASVTVAALAVATALALVLAYLMVKDFTDRIKAIEGNAVLVAQGDFRINWQDETNEISKVFADLIGVFTKLIDEINDVTAESKLGNSEARINLAHFKGGYKETAQAINTLLDAIAEMLDHKEKMQIAQANNQAKSKFLATMSHEIRTPITTVLGISELQLHNARLSLEAEEAFAKIHSSSNILLGIVNDILDLSKIEAGKMEIYNESYDAASLLIDTAQLNMAYLGSKKLGFALDVDERLPAHLIGDELRIKQVLNNLLSNAFKYTEEGTVKFKVYAENGDRPDYVNLILVVQDTGRGMSEAQLEALFDEYARFHVEEMRFQEGSGLGMSITYNLLQMMDGTIDVVSKVGEGTTVTVTLPQKIVGREVLGSKTATYLRNFDMDVHSAAKRLAFTPVPMPYGRVLVVDDVDANIHVTRGFLSLYQLQIDTCTSGPSAIARIQRGEVYDIVFMDQMMPDMDGVEATARIRKLGYDRPIVALTANALVGQAEAFLHNGFDGFLSKPIQTAHLNAVLHKFTKDRHGDEAEAEPGLSAEDEVTAQVANIYAKARKDFLHSQKNAVQDIHDAVQANDFKTARRLAHTLKGLLGIIGQPEQARLAEAAEEAFGQNKAPAALLDRLGAEMAALLPKLAAQFPAEPGQTLLLDKAKIAEIFDQLAPLLAAHDAAALSLLDALAAIPGAEALTERVKAVEFEAALAELAKVRLL